LILASSHPDSPNYGKHWTSERVHDTFSPSQEAVQAVWNWLVASGVEKDSIIHSDNKGWLALDMPVWQAEHLFQTEYYEHVHKSSGKVRVGCDKYMPKAKIQCNTS
jgi:tripeptidyl-peptidase-1